MAALDGVTSATGGVTVEASVSVEVFLGFFFLEDLESVLTAGFWVAEAAIVGVNRGLGVEGVGCSCRAVVSPEWTRRIFVQEMWA